MEEGNICNDAYELIKHSVQAIAQGTVQSLAAVFAIDIR